MTEVSLLWTEARSELITTLLCVRQAGGVISSLVMSQFVSPLKHSSRSHDLIVNFTNNSWISQGNSPPNGNTLLVPFTISGINTFLTVPFFFLFYVYSIKGKLNNFYAFVEKGHDKTKVTYRYRIILLVFTCLLILLNTGIGTSFQYFVSSFVVQHFNLSREMAAYVNAVYLACALGGRITTIWTVSHVPRNSLLIFLSAAMIVACGALFYLYLCRFYIDEFVHDTSNCVCNH